MASTFGWLDTDDEHRRRILEVIDLFKESNTVDELGIGSVRDAIADGLFPGTSVLHTRLRYALFVPWLLQLASRHDATDAMTAEFRRLEFRLIESLLAGGETRGVIGSRARRNLKRLPSGMYWAALGAWGIRLADFSVDAYFRRQFDHRQLSKRTASPDDPDAREPLLGTGLDPHLPRPPEDLLKAATFTLSAVDEQYLSDLIATSTRGSMLSWLVTQHAQVLPDYAWELDNLGSAPERVAELVDHARRFHTAIHGAALVYNLLLARRSRRDEMVSEYELSLEEWRAELHRTEALDGWSRTQWWAAIGRQNSRLSTRTKQFVDQWLDLIGEDVDLTRSRRAAGLVGTRERQIKGGRARLVNQAALDRWPGGSGLGRHDFRWNVARSHLRDLYTARASR